MAASLSPAARAAVAGEKGLDDSTIDNGSTYGQLRFLARVIDATRAERFRVPFLSGLDYLFVAQYRTAGGRSTIRSGRTTRATSPSTTTR